MKKTVSTAVLAAAGFISFGLVFSGPVSAQPGFCDKHGVGVGQIYITACAAGPGGSGGEWHYDDYGNKVDGPEPAEPDDDTATP